MVQTSLIDKDRQLKSFSLITGS